MALAENSGLPPIATLSDIKSRQLKEANPFLGVDCVGAGTNDMRAQKVFETLVGKQQQLLLATQLVKMVRGRGRAPAARRRRQRPARRMAHHRTREGPTTPAPAHPPPLAGAENRRHSRANRKFLGVLPLSFALLFRFA